MNAVQNFYTNPRSVIASFSVGAICGTTNFLFSETVDKIHAIAESRFSSSSKNQTNIVDLPTIVIFETFEEVFYRMILHPNVDKLVLYYLPSFSQSHLLGLPLTRLVSSIGIGTLLGAASYFQNGEKYIAASEAIRNSIYGIVNYRFGFLTSYAANLVKNCLLANLLKTL